jgi:hypothetical protein
MIMEFSPPRHQGTKLHQEAPFVFLGASLCLGALVVSFVV